MVIYFTSEHLSVIPQVAATANQLDYWNIRKAGDVTSLVYRQILR